MNSKLWSPDAVTPGESSVIIFDAIGSNAGLGDSNPGAEQAILKYQIPF